MSDTLDIEAILRQLQQQQPQQPPPAAAEPQSFTSLLGGALGGGVTGLAPEEREAAGNRALLNFGAGMLASSGYRPVRATLGEGIARGLGGATRSVAETEAVSAARRGEQQDYAVKQQELRLAALKEALPLLKLQQDQRALARLKAGDDTGVATTPAPGGTPSQGAVAPIEGDAQTRALAVRDGLMRRGMDLATATAFAANALHESSANPNTGPGDGGASRGLFMWNGPRREAYVAKYGHEPDGAPIDEQLDFVMHELSTSEALAQRRIAAGQSPEEKAQIVSQAYLRPKDTEPEKQRRAATARQLASLAPPTPTEPPQGGRRQEASRDTGTRTDATTKPPEPGEQQPQQQPNQQQPQQQPAGPPPFTPAPFVFRPPTDLPPEQMEAFNPNLSPDVEAALKRRIQSASTTAEAQSAIQDLANARLAKKKDAATALNAERTRQATAHDTEQRTLRDKGIEDYYKRGEEGRKTAADIEKERRAAVLEAEKADAAHRRSVDLANVQGDQARQTESAKTENHYVLEERKRFGAERDGARASVDNLQMLRGLSDKAGTSTPIDNIVVGNMTGRDLMNNLHLGTQAQREKWDAQQSFIAAKNALIISLRNGVQMGALSDADMTFLKNMGPDLLQNPETRASIIALLENAQIRKLRYIDRVEELYDSGKGTTENGKPMTWAVAKRQADKDLGPLIPVMPSDAKSWDTKARNEWIKRYVPPRTIYRSPSGDMLVAPGGY